MLKNILMISHFAGSPRHGMVIRNFLFAREWVRQGYAVTILASDFSHYRAIQPSLNTGQNIEYIDGVKYIWMRGLKYKASSSVGRVSSMAWFTAQCYRYLLSSPYSYDVIIASSPHPFGIYPAAFAAKRQGAYLIYDIRDLWPLTPIYLGGYSPRHPFIRALQHAEDYACKNSDLVMAVQGNADSYLIKRGLEEGRFLHAANGYSEELHPPDPLPPEVVRKLAAIRSFGAFVIGYCGTLGTANAMSLLIEAVAQSDPQIHAAILGEGPEKCALKILARKLGVSNRVHFFDAIPKAAVRSFLGEIDVAYVGGHASPLYKFGASLTKLNDYLAACKPVIYGLGDPRNVVHESGAGVECIPGSVTSLVEAINLMANLSREKLEDMGKKGEAWLKEHRQMSIIAANVLSKLQGVGKRSTMK